MRLSQPGFVGKYIMRGGETAPTTSGSDASRCLVPPVGLGLTGPVDKGPGLVVGVPSRSHVIVQKRILFVVSLT